MQKRIPVITQVTASRIADVFESKGISPFGCQYGTKAGLSWHHEMNNPSIAECYIGMGKFETRHEARPEYYDAEVFALVDGLPHGWRHDVYDEMSRRASEIREANIAATVEGIPTTDAIRAFLRSQIGTRGFHEPKRQSAKRTARGYNPVPGCNARLRLSEAVSFRYTQESYADHSQFAVPVEGNPNSEACRTNLSRLCEAWRTHNGFAGSGCTYTASIHGSEADGWFVVFDCRASISD